MSGDDKVNQRPYSRKKRRTAPVREDEKGAQDVASCNAV
jgi:hypothetical protein